MYLLFFFLTAFTKPNAAKITRKLLHTQYGVQKALDYVNVNIEMKQNGIPDPLLARLFNAL